MMIVEAYAALVLAFLSTERFAICIIRSSVTFLKLSWLQSKPRGA
jgi:hypothetical protein